MGDGYIKIDTKIDETGLDKGISSVDKKLKGTEKVTGSTGKSFATMGLKMAAAGAAIKVVADTIDDLTKAYKKQEKAETQLEAAAKNNPYLTQSSVVQLKAYAGELQAVSTVGDEELLPFMASLAAAGRTQDEIMQIMSASLDMAASGAFTLDSAVRNLNKSYGGLSGELGESIPEIKALTAEQLKNGAATKLMADRYKGIAAQTAATTGTSEQLQNAIGDLKEELGAGWEKGLAPIRRWFTELISGIASVKKARRELNDDIEAASKGIENERGASALASDKMIEYIAAREEYEAGLAYNSEEVSRQLLDRVNQLKSEYDALMAAAYAARYKGREEEKEARRAAKTKTDNQALIDYIKQATEARDKAIAAIRLKAEAEGVEADEMEILDANMSAYVSLITESNGLVTTSSAIAKDWLATVRDQADALKDKNALLELSAKLEGDLREAMDAITAIDDRDESVKMREQLKVLDEMYTAVMNNEQITADQKLLIWQEYTQKRAILEKNITDTEAEEEKARIQASRDRTVEALQIVNEFATQYGNIMANLQTLAYQMIEDDAKIKTAEADKQYADGIISLEEYEAKKKEIEQEAAKDKYKIDLLMWTSSIAQAISNTALGITQALAQGGIFGIPIAAMIGAAGALQLATIVANKPIPPAFATGGVVGGTSYTGDKVLARVNSKERILTPSQNKAFEDMVYGRAGGNVNVYNQAAGLVDVQPQITKDGVQVLIRKTVAQDMSSGRYNQSMRTAQNTMRGVRYTN